MNSSPEAAAGGRDAGPHLAPRPDLSGGVWTRLGDVSVLGDDVTEAALGTLAERTRSAARAQGYAVGWAEGRRESLARASEASLVATQLASTHEQRREDEHRIAVEALAVAVDALYVAAQEVCTRIGDQATQLALEVTAELVGHELAVTTEPGADVVHRVLAVLPVGGLLQVRLHPSVCSDVAVAALAERGALLIADPDLSPGDAIVETDTAAIDLRISTALARLREVLR